MFIRYPILLIRLSIIPHIVKLNFVQLYSHFLMHYQDIYALLEQEIQD